MSDGMLEYLGMRVVFLMSVQTAYLMLLWYRDRQQNDIIMPVTVVDWRTFGAIVGNFIFFALILTLSDFYEFKVGHR